ncbi:MAG: MBOAT family O-acyltransferase, partial [bacterium]
RWHISLSSWFRDYLYIPLGGSKVGTWLKIGNFFIIFLISGFWHGANWTFIIWGLLNAIYILPSVIFKTNRNNLETVAQGKYFPTVKEFVSMTVTFALTVFAWIFFRADGVRQAFSYISIILSRSLFKIPDFPGIEHILPVMILTFLFFVIEWLGREQQYAIQSLGLKWKSPLRWAFYYMIILAIYYWGGKEQQFIYFQF